MRTKGNCTTKRQSGAKLFSPALAGVRKRRRRAQTPAMQPVPHAGHLYTTHDMDTARRQGGLRLVVDRIQRGEGRIRRLGEGGVEEHAGQRAEEDGGGMPRSGCGLGVEEPRRGPGATTAATRARWAWPCSAVVSRLRVSLLMIPDHLLPGVGYMLLSQFAW